MNAKPETIKELAKHISWAKKKNDWMAFGFALQESYYSEKTKQQYTDFRKDKNYTVLLKNSLYNYQRLVDKWQQKIKLEGNKAFGNSPELEKEWYKDKVKILALLKKEAKRLRL